MGQLRCNSGNTGQRKKKAEIEGTVAIEEEDKRQVQKGVSNAVKCMHVCISGAVRMKRETMGGIVSKGMKIGFGGRPLSLRVALSFLQLAPAAIEQHADVIYLTTYLNPTIQNIYNARLCSLK